MSKFVHMELNTADVKEAKKFYKALFGWKYQDMKMPDGIYAMIMAGDEGVGGIQKNPMPGTPNAWLGYVSVDSIKKTVKKVEKRGGKVVVPETDVGMGKLAVIVDPWGAPFGIWEPNPAPPQPAAEAAPAAEKPARKKASKKKPAKKASKKKPAKKASKKKPAKKAAKKKSTKK